MVGSDEFIENEWDWDMVSSDDLWQWMRGLMYWLLWFYEMNEMKIWEVVLILWNEWGKVGWLLWFVYE